MKAVTLTDDQWAEVQGGLEGLFSDIRRWASDPASQELANEIEAIYDEIERQLN